MNLGEKLEGLMAANRADRIGFTQRAAEERRESRRAFVAHIQDFITGEIESGRVPEMAVEDSEQISWLRDCKAGEPDDRDLFAALEQWAAEDRIEIIFNSYVEKGGWVKGISIFVMPGEPEKENSECAVRFNDFLMEHLFASPDMVSEATVEGIPKPVRSCCLIRKCLGLIGTRIMRKKSLK